MANLYHQPEAGVQTEIAGLLKQGPLAVAISAHPHYHRSTGPFGTAICPDASAPGSCMNDATIGRGRYCGFNSPRSSRNGSRQRR